MDYEIDEITVIGVIEMPKRTGMASDRSPQYQIRVAPVARGRVMPELPFLHKGDGITAPDGRTYWVETAKQVPAVKKEHVQWTWVYTVTRDTSDDPAPWDEDRNPFGTNFGR